MKVNIPIATMLMLSLSCLLSCEKRPEKVKSDSKMINIMADMEMAQAYLQNKGYKENTEENRERILQYVLRKNGLDREEFDSTMSWYGRHIDKYDDLYAKVDKELARREARISGNAVDELSNDLWPYSRHLSISHLSSSDNLSFDIKEPEVEKGSKLTWKFHLNIPTEGSILLGVKYKDGKSGYLSQILSGKNIEMTLQTDSANTVRSIFGNLHLNDNRTSIQIDSITLSAVPFDSTAYYKINSVRKFSGPLRKEKPKEKPDSTENKTE